MVCWTYPIPGSHRPVPDLTTRSANTVQPRHKHWTIPGVEDQTGPFSNIDFEANTRSLNGAERPWESLVADAFCKGGLLAAPYKTAWVTRVFPSYSISYSFVHITDPFRSMRSSCRFSSQTLQATSVLTRDYSNPRAPAHSGRRFVRFFFAGIGVGTVNQVSWKRSSVGCANRLLSLPLILYNWQIWQKLCEFLKISINRCAL